MKNAEDILRLFFEAGQLKRVKRSGWWLINIKDPESVAEHSYRAAIIGYVLSKLEGADSHKVVLACLFQDLSEARINDLHKLSQKYLDIKDAEKAALNDQLEGLPIKDEINKIFSEFQNDGSKEGIVARDADILECAVQAKEYMESGHKDAKSWIENSKKIIKTKSAKELMELLEKTNPYDFWVGLKNIKR